MNLATQPLLHWLITSGLMPGSRLPSVRALARLLDSTFYATRLALITLEAQGILERRSPRIFVVRRQPRPDAEPLPDLRSTIVYVAGATTTIEAAWDRTAFGPQVFRAIVDTAARHGLQVASFPPDNATLRRFPDIDRARPAGWILIHQDPGNAAYAALLGAVLRSARPVVMQNEALPAADRAATAADLVSADQQAGAEALVTHLAGLGARRLLPVLSPCFRGRDEWYFSTSWFRDRMHGYARAAAASGADLLPSLPWLADAKTAQRGEFDEAVMTMSGVLAEALLGPAPPDGLIAMEDRRAIILAAASRRLGRPLPVVGYDASWREHPESAWGPLPAATYDQGVEGIGIALVETLLARIAAPQRAWQRVLVPGRLVVPG